MIKSRKNYFVLTCLTIALGLLSRTSLTPEIIYPYAGDFLYALMFFFIVGFLFPKMETLKIMLISIAICYLIECLQLSQAGWLVHLRSYKLGSLILGHGFLWSDILAYTFGGVAGYFFEVFAVKKLLN